MERISSEPQSSGHPGELDRLLRSFFQRELPNPWPGLMTPLRLPHSSGRTMMRSRLALAASIAVLVCGLGFWASKGDVEKSAPGRGTVIGERERVGTPTNTTQRSLGPR